MAEVDIKLEQLPGSGKPAKRKRKRNR